jgi:hypothetical protein
MLWRKSDSGESGSCETVRIFGYAVKAQSRQLVYEDVRDGRSTRYDHSRYERKKR